MMKYFALFLFCLASVYIAVMYFWARQRGQRRNVKRIEPIDATSERDWQDVIHQYIGGVKEYRLKDGTRVDILLPNRAIEIDWQDKCLQSVGQAMFYGKMTNRPPCVILLAVDNNWKRYANRVQLLGVECWVFDTRSHKWLLPKEKK